MPIELWPSFWSKLCQMMADGHVLSNISVRDEINKGKDELTLWIANNAPKGFFVDNDNEVLAKYAESDERIINNKKKYEYASIVRATLSQYELVMLFYNGFYHKKFKMLIEKYALINNLRIGLLAFVIRADTRTLVSITA